MGQLYVYTMTIQMGKFGTTLLHDRKMMANNCFTYSSLMSKDKMPYTSMTLFYCCITVFYYKEI